MLSPSRGHCENIHDMLIKRLIMWTLTDHKMNKSYLPSRIIRNSEPVEDELKYLWKNSLASRATDVA